MDISSGGQIHLDAKFQSSELLVKRLVYRSADEEVLKKMEYYAKKSSLDYSSVR